jgi:phytoene dehydrogenase-like protein
MRHVIIGGGLAGLAASLYLARAGNQVVLCERSAHLGGRAITTQSRSGFRWNLGPHALYARGAGSAVLAELGIEPSGGAPATSGNYAVRAGRAHTLPRGAVSLMTTGLFGLGAKLEAARLLGALPRIDPARLRDVTISAWLADRVRHPEVRELVAALFRLSAYANDPDRASAGGAIEQLQRALAGGVRYLDGGWQTIVDALAAAARAAGVEIRTDARVTAIEHDTTVRAVLVDGARIPATTVVVAAAPATAHELVPAVRVDELVPVRAACLDIALHALPRPRATFALGIDRPLYLSVHSRVAARLVPDNVPGGAVIHVARYLAPDDTGSDAEVELEQLLDLIQPGWRDVLIERRFLPKLVVANAVVPAGMRRPPGDAAGIAGLWLAGDWVGDEGMLSDASLASARRAAMAIMNKDSSDASHARSVVRGA